MGEKMSSTLKRSIFALMGAGALMGIGLITIQAVHQAPKTSMSASAPSVPANHVYLSLAFTGNI
jgi:hypothetical protein